MSQIELSVPIVTPLAQVLGQPFTELPADLYIPPDALQIFLETFEGPLDLLLYLIRRQNLDVLDIPMATLTAQYMQYVDLMQAHQFELAAEYLLMAAVLIEIKSRLLLPRPVVVDEDGFDDDPRAALVQRLLEYEQIKAAAYQLDAMPVVDRDFAWVSVWVEQQIAPRLPDIEVGDLLNAWHSLLRRTRLNQHHHVTAEGITVRQRMSDILRRLQEGASLPFESLFEVNAGRLDLVLSFLAMLELTKEGLVSLIQTQPYESIFVRLAER
ncbi:segregation and condensation protein A [Leeia oryzae]|uniref:segregation and condensation protein A n=1 Tax=Leeia oryzae TaxID=356662 RepID=UPI0003768D5B|nr:ScpA family protein [Leeia oryzae]